jgi:ABC-2 type transport system ATP-binding protein
MNVPTLTAETERMVRTTAPAVETIHLRKVYGKHVAVEDLTLQVEEGEVFGFLGPNGAGKTTSVKMLMGLIHPTSGSARLLDRPLGDVEARKKIGFLPELFRFHDWLKGEELLDLHARLYGMSKAERSKRTPEVLKLVGLEGAARERVRTYSKGMQQRIGLGQALLNYPRLVFLDEPTSALDPLGRRDVREVIAQLRREGMTVFLNSHLLSEVESLCDRVAIVNHGRVAAIGPMAALLQHEMTVELRVGPYSTETLAALREVVDIEHIEGPEQQTLIARVRDEETIARAVDLLVQDGVPVYGVTPERRSLEEVFVDIVSAEGRGSR